MSRGVLAGFAALVAGVAAMWYFSSRPVAEEDWEIAAGSGPPAGLSLSSDIQLLVDRIAGTDEMDATKAWLELGTRFRDPGSYLAAVRPALWDTRPVFFAMEKGKLGGFIFYTIKTPSSKGVPAYVHTVGQALAYHLWQFEDVSNSGFKGTFRAWWSSYAPGKGLPGPR